jgi:hypothetical protein
MKGNYTPVKGTTAISEHLKIVEVKCDVVDEKVCKILKLLSTFNIRKLTSHTVKFFNISEVFSTFISILRQKFKDLWCIFLLNLVA